jgi:hypothetical protein
MSSRWKMFLLKVTIKSTYLNLALCLRISEPNNADSLCKKCNSVVHTKLGGILIYTCCNTAFLLQQRAV